MTAFRWIRPMMGIVIAICLGLNSVALGSEADGRTSLGGSLQPLGVSGLTCSTGEMLVELLESDQGGIITLTDNVWLDFSTPGIRPKYPVTVDTGPYTITVCDGGDISFGGNITFRGSGTVIHVEHSAHLAIYGSVVAEGDGATGMYLEKGCYVGIAPKIEAHGENAIGVYAESDKQFLEVEITASGKDSIAVYTTGSAQLVLCYLEAEGQTVVSENGSIVLEGCYAEPVPPQAQTLVLHGIHFFWADDFVTTVGKPLELGEVVPLAYYGEVFSSWSQFYPVEWDESQVDYNTVGTYPLTGTLMVPFESEYHTWDPLEFEVTVLASEQAYLTHATLQGDDQLVLHLLEELRGAYRVSVWCSDDGGESWMELWEMGMVRMSSKGNILIEGLPDDVTYLFYLDIMGTAHNGESNVLGFYADSKERDGNGEREGDGDEDGNDELPQVTNPPPTSGGEDGGTGHENGNSEPPSVTNPPPAGDGGEGGNDGGDIPGSTDGDGSVMPGDGDGAGASGTGGQVRGRISGAGFSRAGSTAPWQSAESGGNPEAPSIAVEDAPPLTSRQFQGVQAVEAMADVGNAYPEQAQVYTAGELAALAAANPQSLAFLWDGMGVLLPTGPLLEAVGDRDLAIVLERHESGFAVSIFAGKEELTHLGGEPFQVYLPLLDGEVVFLDSKEQFVTADIQGDRVLLTLYGTGTYTWKAQPVIQNVAADGAGVSRVGAAGQQPVQGARRGFPLVQAAAVAVLGTGVAWLHLRRRMRP